MARKFFLFLLLIAGWGLIFYPLVSKPHALSLPWGKRSGVNLPQPWKNGAVVQVLPHSSAVDVDGIAITGYAQEYPVQSGETLGDIAHRCAVPLESLLAANPHIANPNKVYAGQVIVIPLLAGRGGGDDVSTALSSIGNHGGYFPGAEVEIQASGLPPGSNVRVGVGLSSSGYRVLAQAVSGADGRLSTSITLPSTAQPGDRAFILVTATGIPSVQVISPEFIIAGE